MVSPSESLRLFECAVGAPHDRPVCHYGDNPMHKIQQSVSRSSLNGSRCATPGGLGPGKQLRESTNKTSRSGAGYYMPATGDSNSYCTGVEGPVVLSKVKTVISGSANKVTKSQTILHSNGNTNSRTIEESQVDVVRLEDIWERKLLAEGWPRACVEKYPNFLASSTLGQYNACLKKFHTFCIINDYAFPPKIDYVLAVIVNFLNHEAEKSERPESLLKSLSSALKHWLKAHDLQVHHELLDNFMKALIRINTIRPKGRTKILPIQLFMSMFRDWGHNDLLTLGRLRQKAITLLAFAAMCRPSDIAPTCGFK